jgi:nitric oxide reductase large subunit
MVITLHVAMMAGPSPGRNDLCHTAIYYIAFQWRAYGTWYARSAEFLQTGLMDNLRWMRVVGDTIFALGAFVLGYFVLGLVTGHSYDERGFVREGESEIHLTSGSVHATSGD